MEHNIPIGSHVSFKNDPRILIVTSSRLLQCKENCDIPHESDCFDEPYIQLKQESFFSEPLSQLEYVYDPITHIGKRF